MRTEVHAHLYLLLTPVMWARAEMLLPQWKTSTLETLNQPLGQLGELQLASGL